MRFTNRLDEPTTIHWHGIRLPIEMDGVPYISQPPVQPGESFIYQFKTQDAGSYWYHPHLMSSEQLGRGLVGPLIIEEREPTGFRHEVLCLKTWHVDEQGAFTPSACRARQLAKAPAGAIRRSTASMCRPSTCRPQIVRAPAERRQHRHLPSQPAQRRGEDLCHRWPSGGAARLRGAVLDRSRDAPGAGAEGAGSGHRAVPARRAGTPGDDPQCGQRRRLLPATGRSRCRRIR